jgi:glutamate synthase (NADPH/NADH) small chain
MDGIFSAGDMRIGQSLVVRAIADGQAAAKDILLYLQRSK